MLSGPAPFPVVSFFIECTISSLDGLSQFIFSSAEASGIDGTFGTGLWFSSSLKYCTHLFPCLSNVTLLILYFVLLCWNLHTAMCCSLLCVLLGLYINIYFYLVWYSAYFPVFCFIRLLGLCLFLSSCCSCCTLPLNLYVEILQWLKSVLQWYLDALYYITILKVVHIVLNSWILWFATVFWTPATRIWWSNAASALGFCTLCFCSPLKCSNLMLQFSH